MPCYVETNSTNPNVIEYQSCCPGRLFLTKGGTPLFDLGILFAANFNGTPEAPELFLKVNCKSYLMLMCNLYTPPGDGDYSQYLTGVSNVLYHQATVYTP